jgi:hypothetical protein
MTYDGTFWVATEGGGTEGDEDRPVTSRNQIHHVLYNGTIVQTVDLPDATNKNQVRYGFEGVAYVPGALTGGKTYIYVYVISHSSPRSFLRGFSLLDNFHLISPCLVFRI